MPLIYMSGPAFLTYEVLFINEYGKKIFGEAAGKICWQSLQTGKSGPCGFCTNKYLLDSDGKPGEIYTWDYQNTVTGHWYHIRDRAIQWVDGRIVRLEIATDISERKLAETMLAEETERLAVTLRSIGDGVITTDTQGRVVLINNVAESLTGWNNKEAAGRPLAEVFKIINGETIGLLAGGIAHDFNNILAAILGNIDLSLLDPSLTVETQKLLEEAAKASFRARDLTQQLLTFAKGGEPIKETASLACVVKDSADFILRGEKVACRYSFPDDLWLVDIDKGQISQVVQNIILNASNAMPNGGIVEVSCENLHSVSSLNIALPKGR
ncbi:MAG: two-component hybrid sensor and response regulator histidine kinase, partial [Nitrospirae bacterium]|nr:two-component hybrid sensor and response regulator histidine kinase [Nitrospirota bacterium]